MICVRTPYRNEMAANHVIRKSELSEWKRPKKPKVLRETYKCPECGFIHIKKHRA